MNPMKHFFTFFLLVFSITWANAQSNSLTVGGTVSDTNGSPVEGVTLEVFTDSLQGFFFYSSSVTTDAQGQYSDTISMPGNVTQGAIFVNMADCNGGYVVQTAYFGPSNTGLTLDFTYCDVQSFCETYVTPDGAGQLQAIAYGTPPFTYQWSTGAATQSITPNGSGLYCVTVTDATGCEVSSCYDINNPADTLCSVYISLEGNTGAGLLVEANGFGVPPYAYEWSTGETTATIVLTTSGQYCVTLTDSEGCVAVACADANVQPCDVSIQADTSTLTALPSGEAPFAFSWSNGSAASSITPDTDGQYCVTVTGADGCQASACYYWSAAIDTSCYVNILLVQGGAMLEAVADGASPFAYSWSTGATTPLVSVDASTALYCVTITDANGCQSSACTVLAPVENYQVQGYVYLADSIAGEQLQGDVFLIQYDAAAGTLTAVDTVPLLPNAFGGGSYDFGDVPAGEYLVKAALSPSSFGYTDNLPTYYGNTLWWDEASSVTVPYTNWGYFDIVLVEGNNPGGPGFIGGLVTDGANFGFQNRGGGPMAGVSVILLDEFDQPVAYTFTNELGEFEFAGLGWGTYKVTLEIPGHEQVHYVVTLGPENSEVHGLTFEVTEAGVLSAGIEELAAGLHVFPVPARDQLSVQFESRGGGEAILFIADYSGRILSHWPVEVQPGAQQLNLDIGQLPAGLYTLGVRTGKGIAGKAFVKE